MPDGSDIAAEVVEQVQYGIPKPLRENLRNLYWNVAYNNIDLVIVTTGRERFGKTTLAMQIWLYLDTMRKRWGLEPTFSSDLVATTSSEYATLIDKADERSAGVVMFDEAGLGLYNRRSLSKENTAINTILMTCGYKNLVHLLNLPNFFALDREVRTRRVGMLCNVYGKLEPVRHTDGESYMKIDKGWFDMWCGSDIGFIWKDERSGRVHYPDTKYMNLRFAGLDTAPEWKAYLERSYRAKQNYIARQASVLSPRSDLEDAVVDESQKGLDDF